MLFGWSFRNRDRTVSVDAFWAESYLLVRLHLVVCVSEGSVFFVAHQSSGGEQRAPLSVMSLWSTLGRGRV